MAVLSDEHRQFLASHRLCVVGTNRQSGPPALSPVFYVFQDDEIVISITATRHKYRAVERDPNVSLCVLHEEFPFSYLTVYGRGRIEEDHAADVMAEVSELIIGRPLDADERGKIEQRVVDEQRVVMRVTPERVIGLGPPRPALKRDQPPATS
jgi:PPOX class probable F420-dependent enzyme